MPEDAGPGVPGVVICHPHPLFGGNMDNNVVLAVSYALAQQGFATLRFNFRGVGNSDGEHAKGEQEHQEALAAIDLLQAWPGVDDKRIGLVGYSFGTRVICSHRELHKKPKVFALISPSFETLESAALKKNKQPKLIITGDRDKLIQSENLQPVLDSFADAADVQAGARGGPLLVWERGAAGGAGDALLRGEPDLAHVRPAFAAGNFPPSGAAAHLYKDYNVIQLALVVFLLDQLTKYVAIQLLAVGHSFPLRGFFRFTHVHNTGSAFGILQGLNTPLIFVSFHWHNRAGVDLPEPAAAQHLAAVEPGPPVGRGFWEPG